MPNFKKILGGAGALGLTGLGGYAYGGSRGMEIGRKKGLQQGYQMGRRDAMLRQRRGPSPRPAVSPQSAQVNMQANQANNFSQNDAPPEFSEEDDGSSTQEKNAMNRFLKAAGKEPDSQDNANHESESDANRFLKAAGVEPSSDDAGEKSEAENRFLKAAKEGEDEESSAEEEVEERQSNEGEKSQNAGDLKQQLAQMMAQRQRSHQRKSNIAAGGGAGLAGGAMAGGLAANSSVVPRRAEIPVTIGGAALGALGGGYLGNKISPQSVSPEEVAVNQAGEGLYQAQYPEGRMRTYRITDTPQGGIQGREVKRASEEEKTAMTPMIQSALQGPRPDVQMPSAPRGNRARIVLMRVPQRGVKSELAQESGPPAGEAPDGQEQMPAEMQDESEGEPEGEGPEDEEAGEEEPEEEEPEGEPEGEKSEEDGPEEEESESEEPEEESDEEDEEEGQEKEAEYHLEEGDDGWYVVGPDGERKNEEPHGSKAEAREQQKALYANVKDAGLMYDRFSVPAGTDKTASSESPARKVAGTYALAFSEAGEPSVRPFIAVDPNQPTEEKIASALDRDLIDEQDAQELMAMKEAFEDDLEDLDKEAVGMPSKETLMAAGLLAPPAMMAANKAIDPIRERIRYERMKRLPGKQIQLGGEVGGSLENAREEWNIPEEMSQEEATEKARRRAFGILHDQAPEVTRSPSVARGLIRSRLSSSTPRRLMEDAQDLGSNAANAQKTRQQIMQNRGRAVSDASKALKKQTETSDEE